MKVKVTQHIKGYDNDNLTQGEGDDKKPATLRKILCDALTAQFQGEKIDGEEKVRRYELARKVFSEDNPDLLPADWKKIKELVAKAFGAAVVGPVWALLPDKEPEKEPQDGQPQHSDK